MRLTLAWAVTKSGTGAGTWDSGTLWLELFASTVVDSYQEYHICPHTCFFGDAVAIL